jgi:hypothetical protein
MQAQATAHGENRNDRRVLCHKRVPHIASLAKYASSLSPGPMALSMTTLYEYVALLGNAGYSFFKRLLFAASSVASMICLRGCKNWAFHV